LYHAVCTAGSVVEHMGPHAMATQLFLCRWQLPRGAIAASQLEEKSLVAIRPIEGNVHKLAENIQLFGARWCTVWLRGRSVAPAIVNLVAALILIGTPISSCNLLVLTQELGLIFLVQPIISKIAKPITEYLPGI
jgi:hypothetical protein